MILISSMRRPVSAIRRRVSAVSSSIVLLRPPLKPLPDMADPTKAETEQVFKVLKSQKGNKVRTCGPG